MGRVGRWPTTCASSLATEAMMVSASRLSGQAASGSKSRAAGVIKQRYYPMLGFGSFESAARFCMAFDELRQYFRV